MDILPVNAVALLQGPDKAGLRQVHTQLEVCQEPGQALYFPKENPRIRRPDFLLGLEDRAYFGLKVDDLLARSRKRTVSVPRQVAMYLLIHEIGLPPTQVGRLLGGRDHSTVIHGAGKINGEMSEDTELRHDVQAIKESIFA